jgi:hypothetical protein
MKATTDQEIDPDGAHHRGAPAAIELGDPAWAVRAIGRDTERLQSED